MVNLRKAESNQYNNNKSIRIAALSVLLLCIGTLQAAAQEKSSAAAFHPEWYIIACAAGVAFGFIFIAASAAANWQPMKYFVGVDKRSSNSQTQLVLWSATVLGVYLTTVLLRVYLTPHVTADTVGGVNIPPNLLALSGLSGLTFAGARAVTVSKNADAVSKNAAASTTGAADPATKPRPVKLAAKGAAFADLFQNDHEQLDLGDTQMILITFIAVVMYLAKSFVFLGALPDAASISLPDIDTYLLAGFGIGQGTYLAKKAASAPGDG